MPRPHNNEADLRATPTLSQLYFLLYYVKHHKPKNKYYVIMVRLWTLEPGFQGVDPGLDPGYLNDLGQVTSTLCGLLSYKLETVVTSLPLCRLDSEDNRDTMKTTSVSCLLNNEVKAWIFSVSLIIRQSMGSKRSVQVPNILLSLKCCSAMTSLSW